MATPATAHPAGRAASTAKPSWADVNPISVDMMAESRKAMGAAGFKSTSRPQLPQQAADHMSSVGRLAAPILPVPQLFTLAG